MRILRTKGSRRHSRQTLNDPILDLSYGAMLLAFLVILIWILLSNIQ